jgi:hypothetical protein
MIDKLPEWPFPVRPDCAHLSEWKLERQMALVAYWESRCRLAVGALDKALHEMLDDSTTYKETEHRIALALKAIGPLPGKQP